MSIYVRHSLQLIECLIKLDQPETTGGKQIAMDAKMELVAITSRLMPQGVPQLLETVKYPQIAQLVEQYGAKNVRKALVLMVRDFCSSMNVVRNMNQDQMIEAASFLLDECGNFRIEDYHMMFAMGKRGQFATVKTYDRIDIQYISLMVDEFWKMRNEAGRRKQLEKPEIPAMHPEAKTLTDEQMKVLKDGIENITREMGKSTKEPISEDEYKQVKNDYYRKKLKEKINDPVEMERERKHKEMIAELQRQYSKK